MAKTTKPVPRAPAKRIAKTATLPVEHRVAVASVGIAVSYGKSRSEVFELRGTASLNASLADQLVRTTGFVALVGGKGKNTIEYRPASLSRNLLLTLYVDPADLALLRDVFITGTGNEMSDPALTMWATTARPLTADAAETEQVVEFGYMLDFDPAPAGPR